MLAATWSAAEARDAVIAVLAKVSSELSVGQWFNWSARVRAAGLPAACPLLTVAADEGNPAPQRVIAAAMAMEFYDDETAGAVFAQAIEHVSDAESEEVLARLREYTPRVAASVEMAPA
ncbi:hypothetical protein ACFQX7_00975 [Luedemannella flava]